MKDDSCINLNRDPSPIFRDDLQVVDCFFLTGELGSDHLARSPEIFGRDRLFKVQRESFFAGVAGYPLDGLVNRSVVALQVMRVNDVPGILHQIPVALLARTQRLIRLLARGDIASHAHQPGHGASLISNWRQRGLKMKLALVIRHRPLINDLFALQGARDCLFVNMRRFDAMNLACGLSDEDLAFNSEPLNPAAENTCVPLMPI